MKNLFVSFSKYFFYSLEAVVALWIFFAFRVLPFGRASAIGGWVGRTFGPLIPVSQKARKNLIKVFPKKSKKEIEYLIWGMWDNLGRLVGEFPHLSKLKIYEPYSPFEVVGLNYMEQLRDDKKPGIFFSAHIGNWEIIPLCGSQKDLPIDRVYRAANNRLVEWLYRHGRAATDGALIPKGPKGIKLLLQSLRSGQHLGVLMDQKMNDGISVPFFGFNAMTAPAIAELALRFDCPIVPVHIERLEGAKFRIIFEEPLLVEISGDKNQDVYRLLLKVNEKIEEWVEANPEQWLWLHNRW